MAIEIYPASAVSLAPVLSVSTDGETFEGIVSSLTLAVNSDLALRDAYTLHCSAKGLDPRDKGELRKYLAYCLENSTADTTTEDDGKVYGAFTLERGLLAARVNLLGLPQFEELLKAAVFVTTKVRTYFYVMEGRIEGSVELVDSLKNVRNQTDRIRLILRSYGFGNIETLDSATEEGDGCVSVATLASRSLP